MFVMTMKFSKKKAVIILIALAVVLAAIILIVGSGGPSGHESGSGLRTNDSRLEYLKTLGWDCDAEPLDKASVVIPRSFDGVLEEYNRLQLDQGFDLREYAGIEVDSFTYRVINYPSNDTVVAQLFVYNGLLIGGDIHSTSLNGFMHGLF